MKTPEENSKEHSAKARRPRPGQKSRIQRPFSYLRDIRTFNSMKIPGYRFYFLGMMGQWGAMNAQMVARYYLLYLLTGSAAMLGLMSLASALPMIFLSLFGGAIADRVQKKRAIQVGQTGLMLITLGVAIALSTGYLSTENPGSWWILMANALLQGMIMALSMPSRQAIIPEIVDGEQLMNAVALNSLGMNTLRLLAPALAGILIDSIGFAGVYYVMTAMYLMAVVFTSFIPATGTITVRGSGALADIVEGLKYVWSSKVILFTLVFVLAVTVLSMPYQTLMPIFAEDILAVGPTGMGVLMSVTGIGAMAGSLFLASLPSRRRGFMLLLSGLILGLSLAAFSFSRSWPLSIGLMVMFGIGQSGRMTLGNTLLQSYTSEEYLGRVMSISMMDMGLSSFGAFLAGLLAEGIGVQWAMGGFSMFLVVVSLFMFAFVPRLRQLQ